LGRRRRGRKIATRDQTHDLGVGELGVELERDELPVTRRQLADKLDQLADALVTKEAILGPSRRFNEAQLLAGALEAIELPVTRR
jgi:hypothetical protein